MPSLNESFFYIFSAMKIQRVSANNTEALNFSVNEARNFSSQNDWMEITLPSEVLIGKGEKIEKFTLALNLILSLGLWGFRFFFSQTKRGDLLKKIPIILITELEIMVF